MGRAAASSLAELRDLRDWDQISEPGRCPALGAAHTL